MKNDVAVNIQRQFKCKREGEFLFDHPLKEKSQGLPAKRLCFVMILATKMLMPKAMIRIRDSSAKGIHNGVGNHSRGI